MSDHWSERLLFWLSRLSGLVWVPEHRPLHASSNPAEPTGWELVGGGARLPGWHMIELYCDDIQEGYGVHYLLEVGGQRKTHVLSLNAGRYTKRLIYLPRKVDRLYLRPMPGCESLVITHHRFNWMCPRQAHDRLLTRLLRLHPGYRDCEQSEILSRIREQAVEQHRHWRELAFEQYESTFLKLCSREHYSEWIKQVEITRLPKPERHPNPHKPISVGLVLDSADDPEALAATLDSLPQDQGVAWRVALLHGADAATTRQEDMLRQAGLPWHKAPTANGQLTAEAWLSVLGHLEARFWMSGSAGDRFSSASATLLRRALRRKPDAYLVYSDEDELNASGQRRHPRFKPQWNPDLLLSMPYIGRMALYRTDILKVLLQSDITRGLHGQELEYALSLGLLHRLEHSAEPAVGRRHGLDEPRVVHVPHPLYHWQSRHEAPFNPDHAVHRYLVQAGLNAEVVDGPVPGTCHVFWPLPEPHPLVSLVIPTRDRIDILEPCVNAILENTDYPHLEVLVIDNQSECPDTLAYLEALPQSDPRARVLRWDAPFNYSAINNFGVQQARGSVIGLVNNDIDPINPGWLREMVAQAVRQEIGCVGAKLYYSNDTIQHAGVILGIGGVAGHSHRMARRKERGYMGRLQVVQNLSAVTAACLVMRKSVFEEVGGLNASHLKVALNDVDLCLKVRKAGYRNLWTPHAELYHYESLSRGRDDTRNKRQRAQLEVDFMREQWGRELRDDPAYNPNLSLVHEDFSLR